MQQLNTFKLPKNFRGRNAFVVQLWRYVSKVVQFDLGHSFFYNQPVTKLILGRKSANS